LTNVKLNYFLFTQKKVKKSCKRQAIKIFYKSFIFKAEAGEEALLFAFKRRPFIKFRTNYRVTPALLLD